MEKTASQNQNSCPFVSVVVPVLNAPQRAATCIEALLQQTYPRERYEIIVVDNGSSDETPQVIQRYPVTFLMDDSFHSPYVSRNKGIEHAQGEIIAMIDVNCTATPVWLEKGIETMESEGADLVGGQVAFTFSPQKTAAEMLDSVTHVDMKGHIEQRGAAFGGNLFIRKAVLDAVGLFPLRRSGGDTFLTGKASRQGFKLMYGPEAKVFYPARKLLPLLKKELRVGRGSPPVQIERGYSPVRIVLVGLVLWFIPPSLSRLRGQIRERGTPEMASKFWALWLVQWLCVIASNLGRWAYILGSAANRLKGRGRR